MEGELCTTSDVAVILQRQPFIIGGTILENILFGRPLDEKRLEAILDGCALRPDLEQWPHAEHTQVGERGVTLSGGQQQRIAVARALYGDPRMVLADDPLSAVDARTQTVLLATFRAFAREAGGRAILCSLNQPHHLAAFDRVVHVKDGTAVTASTADAPPDGAGGAPAMVDDTVDALPDAQPIMPAHAKEAPSGDGGGGDESAAAKKILLKEGGGPAQSAAPASARPAASTTREPTVGGKETKRDGGFEEGILVRYAKAMGPHVVSLYYAVLICSYAAYVAGDLALTASLSASSVAAGINASLSAEAAAKEANERRSERTYLIVFASCSLFHLLTLVGSSLIWAYGGVRASRTLHSDTVRRLALAPLWWYDSTPAGRIMSRYSSDIGVVDLQLSMEGDNFGQVCVMALSLAGVMMAEAPVVAPVVGVVLVLFCVLTIAVDRASREVRRISNNTVSPILSAMGEMRAGAPLVRAMHFSNFFASRLAVFADDWANFNFLFKAIQQWGLHVTNYLSVSIGAAVAFYLVGTRGQRDPQAAGLTLTYALLLPYFIATVAHHFAAVRTAMASLERVLEYLALPQERARTLPADPPASEWPLQGRLEFSGLSVRYRPELAPSLDCLSAVVEGGQKAGIVGRSGAGKSTLILSLFRLVEPCEGTVKIDGVDAASLGLERMRKAITVIPQDPTLHKGSVAHNLDPFKAHTEQEMLAVLRLTKLAETMLHAEVEKGGANLSSGERQLLCFARALLQRRPILVLDEATSNLDAESDVRIQTLLRALSAGSEPLCTTQARIRAPNGARTEFDGTTLLTIAHRLQTVIDYDTILVLGRGQLIEQGTPLELLAEPAGALSSMVKALGEAGEAELRRKAGDGTAVSVAGS